MPRVNEFHSVFDITHSVLLTLFCYHFHLSARYLKSSSFEMVMNVIKSVYIRECSSVSKMCVHYLINFKQIKANLILSCYSYKILFPTEARKQVYCTSPDSSTLEKILFSLVTTMRFY